VHSRRHHGAVKGGVPLLADHHIARVDGGIEVHHYAFARCIVGQKQLYPWVSPSTAWSERIRWTRRTPVFSMPYDEHAAKVIEVIKPGHRSRRTLMRAVGRGHKRNADWEQ
jgi:hypothetical protein